MHSTHGIAHRDLKPENVVYSAMTNPINFEEVVIKVIDFGFAKQTNTDTELSEFVGTNEYLAPEIISKRTYGKKCDIWSLGVIMYLLLSGKLPF